jgi:heptosyltransferase I
LQTRAQFRLLVVRLGAMGDILHALPAVTALRKMHPGWRIDWAVEPRWRPLLTADSGHSSARPVVDGIYDVPTKAWGKRPFHPETWAAIRALRKDLRAAQYDAVLELQGAIRSGVVARISGCERIVGAARPWEAAAKWLYTERVATAGQHVIEQNFELASAVAGDLLEPVNAALPVDAEAEDWCDELLDLKDAEWRGRPVVLMHPGAGWGAKRWPADRYGAVAAEFGMRGGVVLVNAAPGEEALADAVVASCRAEGVAHAVSCTLPQLIALTRRVSLVIGGDTGPVHLACALSKPVVGIYGPTDPRRNGPYGTRFRVLRNPESRTDHSRVEDPEAGLLTILPEAVIAAMIELMLEVRQARRIEASRAESEGSSAEIVAIHPQIDPVWDARRS